MPRGSQPGERRGGRKAGTPNQRTTLGRELIVKALAEGTTPLEYMLRVLRDDKASPADRRWAAQHAAPYVHPRLNAIEHSGDSAQAVPPVVIYIPTNGRD